MKNGYSILNDAEHFSEEDGSQNYSVFQPGFKYFKPSKNNGVLAWKSKDLSDENIKPSATPDNSVNPRLDYFNNPKFQVEFYGSF